MSILKNAAAMATMLAMTAIAASAAIATPFTNGNFEQSAANATPTSAIPGWTKSGNVALAHPTYFGAGTTAANGNWMIAFNAGDGAKDGVLSQTFDTIAGTTYVVDFGYGLTGCGVCSQELNTSVFGINGTKLGGVNAVSTTSGLLDSYSFRFTADGSSATLRFADNALNQTVSLDGVLDNVSVNKVPEPASLALMSLGLLGLAAAKRRKQS